MRLATALSALGQPIDTYSTSAVCTAAWETARSPSGSLISALLQDLPAAATVIVALVPNAEP